MVTARLFALFFVLVALLVWTVCLVVGVVLFIPLPNGARTVVKAGADVMDSAFEGLEDALR